jgi:hypothetical protein
VQDRLERLKGVRRGPKGVRMGARASHEGVRRGSERGREDHKIWGVNPLCEMCIRCVGCESFEWSVSLVFEV